MNNWPDDYYPESDELAQLGDYFLGIADDVEEDGRIVVGIDLSGPGANGTIGLTWMRMSPEGRLSYLNWPTGRALKSRAEEIREKLTANLKDVAAKYVSGGRPFITAAEGYHRTWSEAVNADYSKLEDRVLQAYSELDIRASLAALNHHAITQTDPVKFFREIYGMSTTQGALARIRDMMIETGMVVGDYVSKRQAAQFMMTEAARQLVRYEMFPEEDPCVDGDVIKFERTFPQKPDEKWTYVAVRVEGYYYLSDGKVHQSRFTWAKLVDWMAGYVERIDVLKYDRTVVGNAPVETDGNAHNNEAKAATEVVEAGGWRDESTGLVSGGLVTDTPSSYYVPRPVVDNPQA